MGNNALETTFACFFLTRCSGGARARVLINIYNIGDDYITTQIST